MKLNRLEIKKKRNGEKKRRKIEAFNRIDSICGNVCSR